MEVDERKFQSAFMRTGCFHLMFLRTLRFYLVSIRLHADRLFPLTFQNTLI